MTTKPPTFEEALADIEHFTEQHFVGCIDCRGARYELRAAHQAEVERARLEGAQDAYRQVIDRLRSAADFNEDNWVWLTTNAASFGERGRGQEINHHKAVAHDGKTDGCHPDCKVWRPPSHDASSGLPEPLEKAIEVAHSVGCDDWDDEKSDGRCEEVRERLWQAAKDASSGARSTGETTGDILGRHPATGARAASSENKHGLGRQSQASGGASSTTAEQKEECVTCGRVMSQRRAIHHHAQGHEVRQVGIYLESELERPERSGEPEHLLDAAFNAGAAAATNEAAEYVQRYASADASRLAEGIRALPLPIRTK